MRAARVLRLVVVVALVATTGVATVVRPTPTTAAPGDWSTVPSMSVARTGQSTTVLNGYVCSEANRPAECGMVLVAGGRVPAAGGTAVTNAAELYNPADGTWKSLPPMSVARSGHTATIAHTAADLAPRPASVTGLTSLLVVAGGETDAGVPTPSVEGYDIVRGIWRTLTPMSIGRIGHSATVLPGNGRSTLFVAGGTGPEGVLLSSVESFDTIQAAGSWTTIAPLAVPRTGHTATGVVGSSCVEQGGTNWGVCNLLVVGGSTSPDGATSTEMLNRQPAYEDSVGDARHTPAVWSAGPNLVTARAGGHTATAIAGDACSVVPATCGDVVIAGGRSATGEALAAAEVFRPTSPELGFQSAEAMSAPRAGHQAVSLADGRVLMVGGPATATSTEIYDPTKRDGRWSAGPGLLTPHATGHTATALLTSAGQPMRRVLVVGGRTNAPDGPLTAAAEVLYAQTAAKTWVRGPAMGIARDGHTATVLPDNTVLVAGGSVDPSAEVYTHDLRSGTGRWVFTGRQLEPRSGHTATLLSTLPAKVLVAGGRIAADSRLAVPTTELYDVATGQWAPAGRLNHARAKHTATRLPDGKVLIVGGAIPPPAVTTPSTVPVTTVPPPALPPAEMYDPTTNSWTLVVPPNFRGREGHTATSLKDGRVLVTGGRLEGGGATRESWVYDHFAPVPSQWIRAGDTVTAQADQAATLLDGPECRVAPAMAHCGKVLVTAGVGQRELFDPSTGTWSLASPISTVASTATLLPSGLVLVTGGDGSTASLYDPAGGVGRWFIGGGGTHLDNQRRRHTATMLSDGKVLIAGGTLGAAATATSNTEVYDGLSAPLDPPSGVTASAVAEDSFAVRLAWTPPAPARSGGTPVTGYRVAHVETDAQGRRKLGPVVVLHDGNQRSAVLSGLPVKAKWTFEVAAFNEAGCLPLQNGQCSIGPAASIDFLRESAVSLALAPTGARATAGNRSATVEWTPPPDNGTVVMGYRITTLPQSGSAAIPPPVDVAATPTTATVTGLGVGQRYAFHVRALSSPTAAGPASSPSNVILIGLPLGKPQVLAATARNRSALVRWQPPPDPGGGPITSYDITAEPGGATTTVGGGTDRAVVTGLTNGIEYRFRVRAANQYGPALQTSDLSQVAAAPDLGAPATLDDLARTEPATVKPAIDALYPRGGPVTGGGEVVITGADFGGATEVRFGDAPPARFQIVSPHQIVAVAPRFSAPGRVHVTVNGPGGGSTFGPDSTESAYYYGSGGWESNGFVFGASGPVASVTALRSGKVLVTAVEGTGAVARLYDPATGRWEATGAPDKAPTLAIPLTDGKVLAFTSVAPSCRTRAETVPGAPTPSAETPAAAYATCTDPVLPQLYNPATGTWSQLTGAQADAARKKTAANGAAAELAGGKILVSGGCCNPDDSPYPDGALNGAEIYDPVTNIWTETASRPLHSRNEHTLTTLSATGCGDKCGFVVAIGGFRRPAVLGPSYGSPEPLLPAPEEYDPARGTWRAMPPMNVNRYGHTSTLLPSGKVLVAGGSTVRSLESAVVSASAVAELYDPSTNSWTQIPSMPRVRYRHTATMLPDGKVLVAGGIAPSPPDSHGFIATVPVTAADIYDPVAGAWLPAGGEHIGGARSSVSLPVTACGVNCGKVMLIGTTGDVELYSPAPVVTAVSPTSTAAGSSPEITITGRGLANDAEVLVGGVAAEVIERSHTTLKVRPSTAPRNSRLPIAVTTTGGEALSAEPFVFTGLPGAVKNLTATPAGTNGVGLAFGAAGSVDDANPPAQSYVIKQSRVPLTEANFGDARSLCQETEGVCTYEIANTGDVLNVDVAALSPNTTYFWAIRPKVGDVLGPMATVSATTGTVLPGAVNDLFVKAQSTRRALLSFSVTGLDAATDPPATDYVIRFSKAPITEASFDTDKLLCEPVCSFVATAVGQRVELPVADLAAGTRYWFALRAVGHGGRLGPLSKVVEMTTVALAPGRVTDLVATPVSSGEMRLSFAAPGSPDADSPPAASYIVKQSKTAITDTASFEAARTLCGGVCGFSPQKVGDELSLNVTGLAASTTYHYAMRVRLADGSLGELSNISVATTLAPCAPVGTAGANQVTYTPGYHLVSVPSGTVLSSPVLYGWFNQGAGRYSLHDSARAETGRGYWAWFACPQLVGLATGGPSSASFDLGSYKASMVGNPSPSSAATLAGHDFAATWDPGANNGSGAYRLSGFGEKVELGVGQAAWAFSYKDTTLSVRSR